MNKILKFLVLLVLICFNIDIHAQAVQNLGDTIEISLNGYKEGTIQWQSSTDNKHWVDLQDENGSKLTTVIRNSASYRASVGNCTDSYNSEVTQIFAPDSDRDYIDELGIILASDKFAGRGPGTRYDTMSVSLISDLYSKNGLVPYKGETYAKAFTTSSAKYPSYDKVPTFNIIGAKIGSDSILRNEVIVISAHYDHKGIINNLIFNGADDNASGVTGLAILTRKFKDIDTKRTLLFIATGAEEFGLLGMREFVNSKIVPDANIKNVINYDMIGRLRDNKVYVYGYNYATELQPDINLLNKDSLSISFSHDMFFSGSAADQLVFAGTNIPAISFTTGSEPDYHKPSDDWDKMNVDGILKIANICFDLIEKVANK